jgi:nucleotide-binding universal stress UspA family protein
MREADVMTPAATIVDATADATLGVTSVLVPTDFSQLSWQVLPLAVHVAKRLGVPVQPVHVDTTSPWWDDDKAALTLRVTPFGRALDVLVIADADPVRGILRAADRAPGATLAMASHGHTPLGELAFGSVAEGLLRRSDSAMITVGPSFDPGRFAVVRRVVAAVDAGTDGGALVTDAMRWAEVLDVPLELVYVRSFDVLGERPDPDDVLRFEALVAEAAAEDGRVTGLVLRGHRPAHEVVSHAAALRGTLLAMSTHALPPVERVVVGSTVAAAVRHSPTGLLLLRRD